MKCLSVKDWEKEYENNRSRGLSKLEWVPIKNKLSGDGYSETVEQEKGAAMYGCWIAIVCLASHCQPRGLLWREEKGVHDVNSISRMIRMDKELVTETIEWNLKNTKWMEEVEICVESDFSATILQGGAESKTLGAASSLEKEIEVNRKEKKNKEKNKKEKRNKNGKNQKKELSAPPDERKLFYPKCHFFDDKDFSLAWQRYTDVRKKKRCSLSVHTLERKLNLLIELSKDKLERAIKILNYSIDAPNGGYHELFQIDGSKVKEGQKSKQELEELYNDKNKA